jgi:hypothetical protein
MSATTTEKTTADLATEIVRGCRSYSGGNLIKVEDAVDAIDRALRDRDERAAKIANDHAEKYRAKSQAQRRRGDESLSEHFLSQCNAALEIASAIKGRL